MKRFFILIILFFMITGFTVAAEDEDISDTDSGQDSTAADLEGEFSSETFSLYGYLVNFFNIDFYFTGNEFDSTYYGDISYLRLKADFNPDDRVSFHAEISCNAAFGNQNPYVMYMRYGFPLPLEPSDYILHDMIQTISLDHFYGTLNIGLLDLQFGKLPIAWGTGYMFNPSQRVSLAPFIDITAEETPGTYGLITGLSIVPEFSLDAYAAFQDKTHKTSPLVDDAGWENIPLGIKTKSIIGAFDLSLGFIREVAYNEFATAYQRAYFISADFAGAVGDIGIYGEAVYSIPRNSSDTEFAFDVYEVKDLIEAVFGCYYTIPGIDTDFRCEYYHQGPGATDSADYSLSDILSGAKTLQAEEYVFLFFEKTFLDYYTASLGGFININDWSFVLFPSIGYDVNDNFRAELGSILFFGADGSEFNGEYIQGPATIDITQPSLYLRCKLSF